MHGMGAGRTNELLNVLLYSKGAVHVLDGLVGPLEELRVLGAGSVSLRSSLYFSGHLMDVN